MKSHISKMRVTALAVGLAIVMSSCGIQNQAGDSSSAPAAGKTKNSALGEWCYNDAVGTPEDIDRKIDWGITIRQWANAGHARYKWQDNKTWMTDKFGPSIVPCSWTNYGKTKPAEIPVGVAIFDAGNPVGVSGPPANTKSCIKPDVKQAMIDGYTEQLNRPLGGEVTEAYIAEMQKGLDITKATCTN